MKFDIRNDSTVEQIKYISFTQALAELSTRITASAIQCWRKHLLLWAIKSERRALARLSDKELEDIGITRYEANAESQKRYYDLPDNRSH